MPVPCPPTSLLLAALLMAGMAASASAVASPMERGNRPSPAALAVARAFLCPHGGTPSRGRRGGRGLCRAPAALLASGGGGSASEVTGWDAGLPPAAHRQAPCPEGTRPSPALARPESVRCLPP